MRLIASSRSARILDIDLWMIGRQRRDGHQRDAARLSQSSRSEKLTLDGHT
jgi:hypothetical protein